MPFKKPVPGEFIIPHQIQFDIQVSEAEANLRRIEALQKLGWSSRDAEDYLFIFNATLRSGEPVPKKKQLQEASKLEDKYGLSPEQKNFALVKNILSTSEKK